jgi:hypothetical protein
LSRKVQFGRKTWKERASLALNQYRTASCGLEEFKIRTRLSLWVHTQFSFLRELVAREWLHEAQLEEARVKSLIPTQELKMYWRQRRTSWTL